MNQRPSGFPLRKTHVVHLNNEYIRSGEIDIPQLFLSAPVDDKIIEASTEIPTYLTSIRAALDRDTEPNHPIGSVCKNPYPCEFKKHCWLGIESDSIHFLTRISDSRRMELVSLAIEKIKDVPDAIRLTDLQLIQVKTARAGVPTIDRPAIKKHLNELRYPYWFLDFETYGFAIPEYNGTWPYQALPFQFSLHVQNGNGQPLQHVEFLHTLKSDPRRDIAEAIVRAIGCTGSVIAFHASFEKSQIKDLADAFPGIRPQLESIIDRIWDLEIPFAKKWYCDDRFEGSSSIKKVLPVLVPEMTYEGMSIAKGDDAQQMYIKMISLAEDDPDREVIYQNLLTYCSQDTMAMVRILQILENL